MSPPLQKFKWISSVVLFMMMLSCSADIDSMALFQADPGIHDIPTNVDFEQIAGGAPSAQFTALHYENHFLDKVSGKTSPKIITFYYKHSSYNLT